MEAGCDSFSSRRPGCTEGFGVPCEDEEKASRQCLRCGSSVWGTLPVCWACRTSAGCPTGGSVSQRCQEELNTALRPLTKTLNSANAVKQICNQAKEHNTNQVRPMEKKIKDEFERLHRFLREEEEARIAALREEERQKIRMLQEKAEKMKRDKNSLSRTVKFMEQQLKLNNFSFLQEYKTAMDRVGRAPQKPEKIPGAMIDMGKHLSNLKYRVWEKMLETVQYNPVILDPNTADPFLQISDNLTSVRDGNMDWGLPDTPERFSSCAEMLGSQGYSSGRHTWDVEVGGNTNWIIGVAGESAQRKALICACPENRIWGVCLRNREYLALESPSVPLPVRDTLQKIRVELDWDGGEVTFSDPTHADDAPLYSFKHPFSERVHPYFSTSCQSHPLRILPGKVLIKAEPSDECVPQD